MTAKVQEKFQLVADAAELFLTRFEALKKEVEATGQQRKASKRMARTAEIEAEIRRKMHKHLAQ